MVKTIGIDADNATYGLVTDEEHGILAWNNAQRRIGVKFDDIAKFDFKKILEVATDEEEYDRVYEFIGNRALHDAVRPIEHSVEAIQCLAEHHRLMIVTGRNSGYMDITMDWMQRHYGDVFAGIVMTGQTGLAIPIDSKLEACRENEIDALVDDSREWVLEVAEAGLVGVLYGDYPWNQGPLDFGARRFTDWLDIADYFDTLRRDAGN